MNDPREGPHLPSGGNAACFDQRGRGRNQVFEMHGGRPLSAFSAQLLNKNRKHAFDLNLVARWNFFAERKELTDKESIRRRLEDYAVQIRKFLSQGVPVGGIGVQGHLRGDSFDPAALKNALDRLAVFKLPIRVTEFNFPGQRSRYYGQQSVRLTDEEEQSKAKALADYYRICFAHPAVEGILMWGFWEGENWIPQSSLYRRDWSETPAAAAYRDLAFKKWWTSWHGRADTQGRRAVNVFFGKHQVTAGGKELVVNLKRAQPIQRVPLG